MRTSRPLKLRALLLTLAAAAAAGCDDPAGPGNGDRVDPLLALAAGEAHACVLSDEGEAWCWGANEAGQLGNASLNASSTPVRVAGGLRFAAIYAGGDHSCALTAGGEAFCWGSNDQGQLGTGGSATSEWEPTRVAGGIVFRELSVGGFEHTCGRTAAGELFCWGGNRGLQLGYAPTDPCRAGTGTVPCSRTPRAATVPGPVTAVSAGFFHTCALRASGEAVCWGDNSRGQLGSGSIGGRAPAAAVSGPVRFSSLRLGSLHSCGVDAAGLAFCWGDDAANAVGAAGTTPRTMPTAVAGGLAFRELSASTGNHVFAHTCGIASDGRLFCWGADDGGQLGLGGAVVESCTGLARCGDAPRAVGGSERWAAVRAGRGFTCAITTAGAAFCWGLNADGQLGNGTTQPSTAPRPVAGAPRLPRAV